MSSSVKLQKSVQLPRTINPEREEKAIREQRRLFNEAIAAHDARQVGATWLSDIQVSASDGRAMIGREAVQKAFEGFFADPNFIAFVRTPTQIRLSEDGNTAAEHGNWVGRWHHAGELSTRHGVYLGSWRKQGWRWLIQAELYVPLGD